MMVSLEAIFLSTLVMISQNGGRGATPPVQLDLGAHQGHPGDDLRTDAGRPAKLDGT
jgi:hypothetical protein